MPVCIIHVPRLASALFKPRSSRQTRKQCTFDELPPERKKLTKGPSAPASPTDYCDPLPSRSMSVSHNYRSAQDSQVGRLDALSVAASEERQHRMRGEPASIDLSTDEHLEPHVITSLVTDDLLPIGSKRTGPESTQTSSSTPYIRQVSYDPNKPQVCSINIQVYRYLKLLQVCCI